MGFLWIEELRQLRDPAFHNEACLHYGMSLQALNALLEDYDLVPKGSLGPPGDEAVPLSMTEIAKKVGLPVKVVGKLQDIAAISRPITCEEFELLKMFSKAFGNYTLLRYQIANLSQKQREELIKRPELTKKWERWVYSRYFYNEHVRGHGGRLVYPERRIFLKDLFELLEEMFHVPKNKVTYKRVLEIRQMANNDRKKVKQGRATEQEVLRSRKLPESELELFTDTYVFTEYS